MKNLLTYLILLIVGLNGFGQNNFYKKSSFKGIVEMPGTKKIDSNLYIDKHELSNFSYLEYMFWIERVFGTNSEEFLNLTPDTTVWNNIHCFNSFTEYYLRGAWYRYYPVVGISQEQAIEYCKWRSDRVFELFLINNGILEHNPNQNRDNYFSIENYYNGKYNGIKPDTKFNFYPYYRLPTIDEWKAGKKYFDENNLVKKCNNRFCDFHMIKNEKIPIIFNVIPCLNDSTVITPTKTTFCFNNPDLGWDFYGNVSEWLNEENTIIGGNWGDSTLNNFSIPIKNENPSKFVGFRCVAEWRKYDF